jgi:glycerophosphoryl diester phosphodiesterase
MNENKSEHFTSTVLSYVNCHLDDPVPTLRNLLTPEVGGFRLDVQRSRDGVCVVVHRDALKIITCSDRLHFDVSQETVEMPLRLFDVLELPFNIANIELMGECVWKQALAAVEASGALNRVIFSSFEHSEILQLWSACHEARCGLSWEDDETANLNHEMLSNLPDDLKICISIKAAKARQSFWEHYRSRLIISGAKTIAEADSLGFEPFITTVDCAYQNRI